MNKKNISGKKKPATKRKSATSSRRGVQVGKINEARKPGWLYYVKGTSVMRSQMKRRKVKRSSVRGGKR